MDIYFGSGNGPLDYLWVLLFYAAMYLIMRYANRRVELNFRRTFVVIYVLWSLLAFSGNYLFYLFGWMSILPWVNNAVHSFIWIGGCLGFLYAGCYRKPLWEQAALFAIFSFIVKIFEHRVLGTWEQDHFFFIPGQMMYMLGWSLFDGLIPVVTKFALRFLARFIKGIAVP